MKIRHLLTLAAAALTLSAWARPAAPFVFEKINPDGTAVEVRLMGDEHFSFLTSADGSIILEKNADGFYTQARREGRLLTTSREDIILYAGGQQAYDSRVKAPAIARMAGIDNEGRTKYPTMGTDIRSLVVPVQFDDRLFTIPDPQNTISRLLNEPGFSDYDGKGSARDYYIASSHGKFAPTFDVAPVVTLTAPAGQTSAANYYCLYQGGTGSVNNPNMAAFLRDALTKLAATGFDFSPYDYDNNGTIDTIYFIYAGYGMADSGYNGRDYKDILENTIWPHQGHGAGLNLTLSGKKFDAYACSNELKGPYVTHKDNPKLDGMGCFVHEYGHVLGLPDLYDTDYAGTTTPGKWSVMDAGSYNEDSTRPPLMSAFEQWCCRWIEFQPIEEGQSYTLTALDQTDANAMRVFARHPFGLSNTEYYVFESRAKRGWDLSLPDHGMMVWHIAFNKTRWEWNIVNYNGVSRVLPVAVKGSYYAWPGIYNGKVITFDDMTPIDTPTDGAFRPLVTDITYDKETGTAGFSYNVRAQSDVITEFLEDRCNYQATDFCLQWTRIPEAQYYLLSVWRDNNGNPVYLNNTNKQHVYSSYYRFTNVGNTNMKRTFTAEVVPVIDGIPAFKKAQLVFVPNQLNEGNAQPDFTAVDTIEAEQAGAVEVYNLQGLRVGASTEGLPAGIYIVRQGGTSRKLVVR